MNALVTVADGQAVTMTSIELVEFINSQRGEGEAELRHDHFMAKVPKVLGADAPKFLGTQNYGNNNTRSIYSFPKREACLMAMSYSYDLQAKVFDRMTALEANAAQPVIAIPNFANPAEAARAWAEQYEARALAEKTKAEIGTRREATAMATASQATRKAARLEIMLDKSMQYASVKRMEAIYRNQKFNWRLLKAKSAELGIPPLDAFDQNFGTVKAYHTDVWMEAYGLSIAPLQATKRNAPAIAVAEAQMQNQH